MAESRHRADVTSRTRAPESWDAGLHAESERGTIDLGLCIEPTALGLVLEVPDFGILRLGFDLGPDGETRLASGARVLGDGRVTVLMVGDQGRVARLEGSLAQAIAERDDVRAQALALHDAKSAAQAQVEALVAEQRLVNERAAVALQTEQDQRLLALGEREKARAELERLRGELDAGSTTLVREVNEARAAREASEEGARRLSAELLELSTRLKSLGDQHEQLLASKKELEQQQLAAVAELETSRQALTTNEVASKAEIERLCVELADATEALSQARAAALAEEARLHDELAEATQALTVAQTAANADHVAASAENERLHDELSAATQALSAAQAVASAAQTAASAETERLHDELAEASQALTAAQAAASAAQAAASAENERLHEELAEATHLLTLAQTASSATHEASVAENERLCDELAAATEALTAARAAAMAEEARLHEELGAASEALSAACLGALEEKNRLESALNAATSDAANARSEAQRALQDRAELASSLEVARLKQQAAEREVAELQARVTAGPEPVSVPLGGSPAATTERLAVLQVRVDEAQLALGAEREQTETAREVARQLKLQLEKVTRERDEARSVARQLHQKMASHEGGRITSGGREGVHEKPRSGSASATQPPTPAFEPNEIETDPGHPLSPLSPPTRKAPDAKKR